jgi:hypothetical protein
LRSEQSLRTGDGRKCSGELFPAEEEGFDLLPVEDAGVVGEGDVVGRVVEDAGAGEGFQLAGVVVDEEVGAQDGLVSTEDDVGVGDEGEVTGKPVVLGVEGGGDLHCGGGDEDLIALLQGGEDSGRVGHDVEIGEEVFGAEVVVEDSMVSLGDDLPEALAVEVGLGEGGVVVAVVAEEMFGDGVGHDFVHVDADALAGIFHVASIIADESRSVGLVL